MEHGYLGPLWAFFITSLISLMVIIDPLGNIFPYLALAGKLPRPEARDIARRACFYSFGILAVFEITGRFIISFFGISLPAFQITGGLILFRIALDMLHGRGHFNRMDTASSLDVAGYEDVALVPLAVPLMAGPGAITTALVLASRARNPIEDALLLLAVAIVLLLTFMAYIYTDKILSLFKERSIRLLTRIMGLILASLAVEFVLQGIKAAFPSLLQ